jgi:hypothetical protein
MASSAIGRENDTRKPPLMVVKLAFYFRFGHFATTVFTVFAHMVATAQRTAFCIRLNASISLKRVVRTTHAAARGGSFSFWNSHGGFP